MRLLICVAAICALAACSGYTTKPDSAKPAPLAEPAPVAYERPCASLPTTPEAAFECDRRSILAMAGEFRVRFAFDETAALAPGYAPHAAQRSGGTEWVTVVVDDGRFISLQHILVMGKDHIVVKHWRQDWQFEPASVLRYRGNGEFAHELIPAEAARGIWSQTVYEVDDAPRYGGIGRWTHAADADAWESDRSWRPLPRREYSKRKDYQLLDVVNRHTLTPSGWVHEQDNTKIQRDADGSLHALAREHGINSYKRISDYDFSAGRTYWEKTRAFWSSVRQEWTAAMASKPRFKLSPEPNGEPRAELFFNLAEKAVSGEAIAESEIKALVDQHLGASSQGRAAD